MLHRDMSFRGADMTNHLKTSIGRGLRALSMPWDAFVAAFLYYTILALFALGGATPGVPVVATAYLAPLVVYLAALGNRALRAVSAWSRDVAQTARVRVTH
jgi:hypothetical protein